MTSLGVDFFVLLFWFFVGWVNFAVFGALFNNTLRTFLTYLQVRMTAVLQGNIKP